ncbi:MAG: MBL fold metallo-hydrolase [Gemmatimonadota bacterium]|nr:MBL fold metallo-hydrolase [Gemmatimonadota bacterium]
MTRREARRAYALAPVPPAVASAFLKPCAAPGDIIVTWVGHSSFLLQMGDVNVLLDPVWSERASPVSFLGPKRMSAPGVAFDQLPPIDLVVMSHDHYDHLDLGTVHRIVSDHPAAEWIAPLGTGAWLRKRGAKVIAELDWWHGVHSCGLDITCTPAQHFSGRRVNNRNSTLWCGWTIRAGDRAVFFTGDTGRHPEFGAITRELGPFDAAFMPIGAYDPRWFMGPVHMAPEEAVSAYTDIVAENGGRSCVFIAMHWGTFKLTDEPMDEPPRLTRSEWTRGGLDPALLWIADRGETRRI